MKKILILNIGTNIGGIESSLINFLHYLSGKNYHVDLVLWKDSGPLYQLIPSSVHIIHGLSPGSLKTILRTPGMLKKGKRILWYTVLKILHYFKKPWFILKRIPKHYDVAISYCQNGYSPYYLIDKVSADKRYMWYHHGSYEKKGKDYKIDTQYYPRLDGIIAVSTSCKEAVAEKFPYMDNKISVINNIINIDRIREKAKEKIFDIDKEKDKFMFVTVSRFSYEKGIDVAIKTAAELKRAGCPFIWYFIGTGEDMEKIKMMVKERQLEDTCILLGEKTNPFPYVSLADIYIQTTRVEAHPITIAEAMVLQKVIVATKIPAITAMLEDGYLGEVCPLDERLFADAILKLVKRSADRTKYIDRLKQFPMTNQAAFHAIDELINL
ncbi:glycosyltransferase [Bacillus benzoevorans]|uniref:Glycosyltransferase involved in cell wall biosynthesis n=1 Tax=Bacillus benzoevorans TaxID=1456 RepID=A0A7X0HTZ1_9BACI|nr:glycosyltransferase [Bacillus benzoevorans]MBB6446835.1 glycosyltransferase involved in cell wall biosynthesis [Bacillus benzoevorans]